MRFSSTTSTKAERDDHEATEDRFKAARAGNHSQREFAEIDAPRKLVMTRKFEQHPLLGTRETTITYRLDPITTGTRSM